MLDYVVIADKDAYSNKGEGSDQLWSLIDQGNWIKVIDHLKKDSHLVSSPRMMSESERKEGKHQDLSTPLHKAVEKNLDKKFFEKLVKRGALKSPRNSEGETPYDLAKKSGKYGDDILKLLQPPDIVMNNEEAIKLMEPTLHKIVKEAACGLIEEHGVVLPQVAVIFEKKERMHYLIPGMYGGFNFEPDLDNFQIKAFSFCRIVGGSEREHVINKDGSSVENHIPYP